MPLRPMLARSRATATSVAPLRAGLTNWISAAAATVTWLLPRLAGSARALGMMLLGEPLPAATAAEWGLIWKVVDDEKLMSEARVLATKLAQGPTIGLGLIKEALNRSLVSTLDAQLDAERDLQRIAATSADFREGVAAFLEKRPARFTGR